MKTQTFLLIVTIAGVLVCPASAGWDPGDPHKMHYPQLPDLVQGLDVLAAGSFGNQILYPAGHPLEGQGMDLAFVVNGPIPGDANTDGVVDVGDLGILAGNYDEAQFATSDFIEQWVPYMPSAWQTDISVRTAGGVTASQVELTFSDAGYRVSDWGLLERDGDVFSVDTRVERWTGLSAQIITTVSHDYDLGSLTPGEYTFAFSAWGWLVESARFRVPLPGDANGDWVVDVSDLSILVGNYGGAGTWTTGDFNGDGNVDVGDLGILAGHYDQGDGAIPEPATVFFLAAGGLILLRKKPEKPSRVIGNPAGGRGKS